MISEIYQAFAEASSGIPFVCGPGCATCCTRSVTLTTAEGRLLGDFLREKGLSLPPVPFDQIVLRPALTTNGLAGRYLAGQEVAEDAESPWLFEPCFFLRDDRCTVYEVRPFACRSFGSTVNCKMSAMAEVPEWLVTLTIVTNQLLESLDHGGFWGNLIDVLKHLDERLPGAERRKAQERLLPNLPVPGVLLAPAEKEMVAAYLKRILTTTGLDLAGMGFSCGVG